MQPAGTGEVLLLTADALVVRGVHQVARDAGLVVVSATGHLSGEPAVVVVDLEQPGAIDEVQSLRRRYADALLVGHLGAPSPDRWVAAERAGCDVVANRGATAKALRARLREGGSRRRRFPLVDATEVAGRLGLVARVPDTPVGPVALYQVEGSLVAVEDVCPHAGATLSEGIVEGRVVTCPRHASSFDVCTGERLRGPCDRDLRVFEVVVESGRVHLAGVENAAGSDPESPDTWSPDA